MIIRIFFEAFRFTKLWASVPSTKVEVQPLNRSDFAELFSTLLLTTKFGKGILGIIFLEMRVWKFFGNLNPSDFS